MKIILLVILLLILLLIITSIIITNRSNINEKFISAGIKPVIYKSYIIKRPVNTPLTALISPYQKVDPKLNPYDYNFATYRTQFLSPVRDQGNDCQCCWAFATCDIISDRLSIMTNGQVRVPFSVQQLLSCVYNGKRNGCEGGNPEEAFEWISNSGYYLQPITKNNIDLDYQQIPSKTKNPSIISTTCSNSIIGVNIERGSVHSIVRFLEKENINKGEVDYSILLDNIYNMKAELLNGGPFYCAMTVYEDFYEYEGQNVYVHNKNSKKIGGHSIEIIGYCDEGVDNRIGFTDAYWICKNSWGKNWPINSKDKGFFAIKMGVNECGIESRCGFANPKIDKQINVNRFITMYTNYNIFKNNLDGMFTTKKIIVDEL